MGSFFTNLQARLGSGVQRAELVDAVAQGAVDQGFERCEAPADRGIVVGPERDGGWVTVWDEASDDAAGQRELAERLRSCCDALVSVEVHDGDALHMELFRPGEQPVSLDHGVDLTTGKLRSKAEGSREPWLRLTDDPARAERLRAALDTGDAFGEGVLEAVAAALGWHRRDAGTSYRYLLDGSHLEANEATTLHFRQTTRPAYETPMTGPPELMKQGYTPEPEVKRGRALELHHSVSSMGGSGCGIDVTVRGPAIDEALFTPEAVRLWWGDALPGNELVAPMELLEDAKGAALVAAFPTFEIPAGLTDPYGAMAVPATMVKASKAFRARHVHVFIQGRASRLGTGDLRVTVAPHANPGGRARFRVRLRVER